MISNNTNTAARLYRTPALLKASVQALDNVVFVIVVQSMTPSKLLNRVIAMNMPTTIIAMLIMLLKSTMVSLWLVFSYKGLIKKG